MRMINNERLSSVLRLFQTVSLGISVNRGNPPPSFRRNKKPSLVAKFF